MKKHLVKVVVPLYREEFSEKERLSALHNLEVLRRYPTVFLLPEGCGVPQEIADEEVLYVTDEWLGTKHGIAGYNRMMMDRRFYDLFADCEYILICQTDAWIFRDELEQWCIKGYDYVAAPWAKRDFYFKFPVKQYLALRRFLTPRHKMLRQDGFNRIGNGGLSLRKVDSFRAACDRYADRIAYFNTKRKHLYNEDFFWACIPEEFTYPTLDEALGFSFDVRPEFLFRLANGRIPFGCHAWYKPKMYPFWRPIIEKK